MIIVLTEEKFQRFVIKGAKQRHDAPHRNYMGDGWDDLGDRPRIQSGQMGRIGEACGAYALDVPVQPAVLPEGRDQGWDVIWKDKRVEFRFKPRLDGEFAQKKSQMPPDMEIMWEIGILILPVFAPWTIDQREFNVAYWITKEDFLKKGRYVTYKKYPDKPQWQVRHSDMEPFETLIGMKTLVRKVIFERSAEGLPLAWTEEELETIERQSGVEGIPSLAEFESPGDFAEVGGSDSDARDREAILERDSQLDLFSEEERPANKKPVKGHGLLYPDGDEGS